MGTTSNDWRAWLVDWSLRGAGMTLGLLVVALLTATGASAQTADLSVTQAPVSSPVAAGSPVNLTITVRNNGPSAAMNVALVHFFPPNSNLTGNAIPGWSCGFATLNYQCTIPSLAAGTSTIFNASYKPSTETPAGAVFVNDALIMSTTVDPNPVNNLASMAITIDPGGTPQFPADFAVTKTGPATGQPGQPIPYTVTVTNNGPNASFLTISEATPPNTTFLSLAAPPAWDCDSPVVGAVGSVQCSPPSPSGTLGAGATATITLTVQTLAGTPLGTTITNVGSVSPFGTLDPTLSNNRVTFNTLIQVPTATPTATPTRIAGDFNGDGFVDIRDYGVWRLNFGQTNCGNPADADGNCLVDIRDYGIWRQHFGEGTPRDRRPGAALPAGISPAPGGTPGPALLGSDQAVSGKWEPHEPGSPDPAVPIVPLVGGLVGLGGLAGWRARRSPQRE